MSSPSSDPLLLFTSPKSSSPGEQPPTSVSVASTNISMAPKTRPQASFFIELPVLSESERTQYKPVPDEFKDGVAFDRDDIDTVVGEYHDDTDFSYFVRFKDGLAYRVRIALREISSQI